MKNIEYMKCNAKDGICKFLRDYTQPEFYKKGFVEFITLNIENRKTESHGVLYKQTPKGKGIVLNFCPFCGESLKELLPQENNKITIEKQA